MPPLQTNVSFTEVLESMRDHLKRKGYSQIPQLSSMNPIDVNTKFDLVPDTATGKKLAVMIGINYVGEYEACCDQYSGHDVVLVQYSFGQTSNLIDIYGR